MMGMLRTLPPRYKLNKFCVFAVELPRLFNSDSSTSTPLKDVSGLKTMSAWKELVPTVAYI